MILPLVLIDQYLKYLSTTGQFSTIDVYFFKLTVLKNYGVSFGLLGQWSWLMIACIQLGIILLITQLKLSKAVKTLLLSGGISNLIDRCYYGYIVDYIHFQYGHYQWPTVVNLADIYLTLAIILWLLQKKS